METDIILQSMRDPLGVPFYPIVFQGLAVLTFALHIVFVNLVIGGALVAAWGHFSKDELWNRLSRTLAKATTISISAAIVLGVAPLLFVQVIYDPLWYTANLLSAWWTVVFLLALIIGALAMYAFYLRRRKDLQRAGSFGLIAVACFLVAAFIIHTISMEALFPGEWQSWFYSGTKMNTDGTGLYAFEFGRLMHFIVPALLNIGIFLMLYAWYFRPRPDIDNEDLSRIARLGLQLARFAVVLTALVGVWWLLIVPDSLGFLSNHGLLAGIVFSLGLMFLLFRAGRNPAGYAPHAALLSVVTVVFMSLARESLRMGYLEPFAYSVYEYPMTIDWGSTALFLGTFVLGAIVVAYLLRLAFTTGRREQRQSSGTS